MQASTGCLFSQRQVSNRLSKRTRRTITLRVLGLVLALLVVLVGPQIVHTMQRPAEASMFTYVVAQGDTLWDIAAEHSEGKDLRRVVSAIRQASDLKSAELQPGMVLSIPSTVGRSK